MNAIPDGSSSNALPQIFPLLPWALSQLQQGIQPAILADLDESTKASMVHDLVMSEGDRRFAEHPEIQVVNSRGLRHFVLPDMLVRVKRAHDRTLRISTNATNQTSEWTYQLPLNGMADPRDHLHLVYVPDPSWTRITRSVVALYHGDKAQTGHDIDVEAWYDAGGAATQPFAPERLLPPLRLKPGVVRLPLEANDGTQPGEG